MAFLILCIQIRSRRKESIVIGQSQQIRLDRQESNYLRKVRRQEDASFQILERCHLRLPLNGAIELEVDVQERKKAELLGGVDVISIQALILTALLKQGFVERIATGCDAIKLSLLGVMKIEMEAIDAPKRHARKSIMVGVPISFKTSHWLTKLFGLEFGRSAQRQITRAR